MRKHYTCWVSATCYVCRNTTNGPFLHASTKGFRSTSPCSTMPIVIEAENRKEALKLAKKYFAFTLGRRKIHVRD